MGKSRASLKGVGFGDDGAATDLLLSDLSDPPPAMADLLVKTELPPALIQAESLPSLPTVALEVLRLTQDEDSTIQDLAETIGRDPALAAKLLKLANSSLFNPGKEIATLQRATMVLGMKTVKLLSLSFSLVDSLPAGGVQDGFDFGQYWRRSLTAAVAGKAFAQLIGYKAKDEVFLVGLLGHLGRLVMGTCLTDEYTNLTQIHGNWPSLSSEASHFGFCSAEIGGTLLHEWELPESIYAPVSFSGRPEELPAETTEVLQQAVAIAHIAHLAEEVLCGQDQGAALKRLETTALSDFQQSTEDVTAFLLSLESVIDETADLLELSLPEGQPYEELLNQARAQMVNVSLGAAMDLQQARRRTMKLEAQKRKLQVVATTDALTGLPNRKAFDDFLARHVAARIEGTVPRALGIVMIDVDKFKTFNDDHGHQAGDEVLRMVGKVLASMTRGGDLAARYGGEEFAVIAPQNTPFGIKTLTERLRQALADEVVEFEGKALSVTASFGGACIASFSANSDASALIKLADHYLYKAKENGRNRCEVYPKVQFPGR